VSAREEISLSSFGRNPAILKTLLDESRRKYLENDGNKTLIYRGIINARSAEPCWRRCMSRPSRPLSTIVADEAMKEALVDDLRDYLHPRTRRWYSNHGIPYRRGYLLYGPPGTGKSSLSFAIAGYFKLRIYVVSLNTLAMNEQNLSTLFAELPRRCVVLLEDIDSAELTHTRQIQSPSKSDQHEVAMKLKQFKSLPPMVSRISLSALLNVIDGVASQEGRILIMTTNHAERLDDALIRPGRVDMKIKFELASSSMIVSLFRNIFSTAERGEHVEEMNIGFEEQACNEGKDEKYEEKIIELSQEFAALVPADTCSPAEVQGFLLEHKRFPERAVAHAAEWVTKRTLKMREE
jgi:chaperone BCS1